MNLSIKPQLLSALILLVGCEKGTESVPTSHTFEKTVELRNRVATAASITELRDGSLLVVGSAAPVGAPTQKKLLAVKLTAGGDTIWTKQYAFGPLHSAGYGTSYSCLATADGNVVVSGYGSVNITQDRAVVFKLDGTTGTVLWNTILPIQSTGNQLAACSDGGFLILGGTYADAVSFPNQAQILKINADGAIVSTTAQLPIWATNIRPLNDGGFIVKGMSSVTLNKHSLTKLSAQGSETQTYPILKSVDFNPSSCVAPTEDGGYALVNERNAFGPAPTSMILKTDTNGKTTSVNPVIGLNGAIFTEISAGPDNSLIVVGEQQEGDNILRTHPLAVRVSLDGKLLAIQTKLTTVGCITALRKTDNGQWVMCSTEAGKIGVSRTNNDLSR